MSTLPYDYARCNGTPHDTCKDCRRKEPGHPTYQSYMSPPVKATGVCDWRIGPSPASAAQLSPLWTAHTAR